MTDLAMQARGLDTYYGRVQILHGLDLDVPAGKITAIIGPNGAGKSTALKALFGLVEVSEGSVHLAGRETTNSSPADMVAAGVCFVPQGRAVFPSLSVQENLRMGGFHVRDQAVLGPRMADVYARFPRLEQRRMQSAGSLSGGEQQMLALGRALMADPSVMLLDEPSVGLAPKAVAEVLEAIRSLRDEGRTIVIVEQNATMALQLADHANVLVRGSVRLSGTGTALLADPTVREVYLGSAADER